jgi:hypothetical protein
MAIIFAWTTTNVMQLRPSCCQLTTSVFYIAVVHFNLFAYPTCVLLSPDYVKDLTKLISGGEINVHVYEGFVSFLTRVKCGETV